MQDAFTGTALENEFFEYTQDVLIDVPRCDSSAEYSLCQAGGGMANKAALFIPNFSWREDQFG